MVLPHLSARRLAGPDQFSNNVELLRMRRCLRRQGVYGVMPMSIHAARQVDPTSMRESRDTRPAQEPRVGLFVTCLVDLIRPSVGFAAVKLLEDAGCIVEVPAQTCCGQPAYNSGDRADARATSPSRPSGVSRLRLRGGAVGLLRRHAEGALSGAVRRRSELAAARQRTRGAHLRADELPGRRARRRPRVDAAFDGTVTYHDSCSGLRELGVRSAAAQAAG